MPERRRGAPAPVPPGSDRRTRCSASARNTCLSCWSPPCSSSGRNSCPAPSPPCTRPSGKPKRLGERSRADQQRSPASAVSAGVSAHINRSAREVRPPPCRERRRFRRPRCSRQARGGRRGRRRSGDRGGRLHPGHRKATTFAARMSVLPGRFGGDGEFRGLGALAVNRFGNVQLSMVDDLLGEVDWHTTVAHELHVTRKPRSCWWKSATAIRTPRSCASAARDPVGGAAALQSGRARRQRRESGLEAGAGRILSSVDLSTPLLTGEGRSPPRPGSDPAVATTGGRRRFGVPGGGSPATRRQTAIAVRVRTPKDGHPRTPGDTWSPRRPSDTGHPSVVRS